MFRFGASIWLIGLLVVPALVGLLVATGRARRRALAAIGDLELVERLSASVNGTARRGKSALQVAAVALLVFAMARPQFGNRVETVRSMGQDIVVALDLSQSMLAEDVAPNRLERARLAVFRLLERLDGDRIGLVAFAADAFVQMPLTTDYGAAAMFLRAMEPDLMPVQGTDLGAALRVSLDALEQGGREERVLILVSDGEDHEEAYDAERARLDQLGVQLYVVGIGGTEGEPIPVYDDQGRRTGFLRDDDDQVVTTRLEEATLQSLTRGREGAFVRAGAGGAALDELIDHVASGQGDSIEERQVTRFEEQYQLFVGFALLLLLVEMLLSERRRPAARPGGEIA